MRCLFDVRPPGVVRRSGRGVIAACVRGVLLSFRGLIDRFRGSLPGAGRKQSQDSDTSKGSGKGGGQGSAGQGSAGQGSATVPGLHSLTTSVIRVSKNHTTAGDATRRPLHLYTQD